MKQFFTLLILTVINFSTVFGQTPRNNISYSRPYQVDSSEYFMIGTNVNETNKTKFNVSRGKNYNWTNIIFYNSKTKESKQVFTAFPILISQVSSLYSQVSSLYNKDGLWEGPFQEKKSSSLTNKNIILLVQEDSNKNGIVDDDDISTLYILTKTGTNLTQISPSGIHVKGYTLSLDEKIMLVKATKDNNKDGKYFDEDEVFYQINMDSDFSKIASSEIKLK